MANSVSPHKINLGKAKQMTQRYRQQKDQLLKPEFSGRDIFPISETISREAVDRLLAQPGCTGIRFYYGMDEQLRVKLVLVGVDAQNEDMLKVKTSTPTGDATAALSETNDTTGEKEAEILDETVRCPPGCVTSELNP